MRLLSTRLLSMSFQTDSVGSTCGLRHRFLCHKIGKECTCPTIVTTFQHDAPCQPQVLVTHQQHTHMLLPHPVLLPSLLEACYPQCHAVQLASQDFLRAACSPVLWAHHCQQHQHHKQHHMQHLQQHRAYSSDDNIDGRIGADPEQVADLLEANIYHPSKAEREQLRQQSRSRLLTTRREALSLYREVLRYSNLFVWKDEHGRMWKDVIRASARQEFEAARREPDPELVNRMIVTGRDAVQRAVQGFLRQRGRIIDEESSKPQVPPMHE